MDEFLNQLYKTRWLEIIAMISGLLFPILSAYEKIICWLFGGISSAIYIYLFIEGKLYQDAGLNLFYVVMSVIGFLMWKGIIKPRHKKVAISVTNFPMLLMFTLMGVLYTIVTGYIFKKFTDAAYPYVDAFVTGFSFIATWLDAQKKIENWVVFFVADAVGVWLFWQKGFILTSVMFTVYCCICIFGFIKWRNQLKLSKSQ